jgi:hypothetical protein
MLCVQHPGATENWTFEQLPYKDRATLVLSPAQTLADVPEMRNRNRSACRHGEHWKLRNFAPPRSHFCLSAFRTRSKGHSDNCTLSLSCQTRHVGRFKESIRQRWPKQRQRKRSGRRSISARRGSRSNVVDCYHWCNPAIHGATTFQCEGD